MIRRTFVCILALAAVFMLAVGQIVTAQTNDDAKTAAVESGNTGARASNATRTNAPAKRIPKTASTSDWTGAYVGGYAGFGLKRGLANTSTVFSPTGLLLPSNIGPIAAAGRQALNSTAFTGGGTFGYNHQSGRWVGGGEVDFGGSTTGTRSVISTATLACACGGTIPFSITQSVKTSWLFTARPRVGITAGNALFYVTGGLALTRLNYQAAAASNITGSGVVSESGGLVKTKAGWTGGGGVEVKVSDKWSIKSEYLYADFRRSTITSTNLALRPPTGAPILFPSNVTTHSIYYREHDLRFGFNYHF